MLTTPITNNQFRSRVLNLFSETASTQSLGDLTDIELRGVEVATLSPLTHSDTSLLPSNITSQLVGVTSDWIDLGSPDPLVAEISRQVLSLEVQYAAFCGIDHIVIHGPRLYYGDAASADLPRYARCIQEAMELASHASFYLKIPMFDHPDLSDYNPQSLATREEYLDVIEQFKPKELDLMARWDSWNLIRSTCKYSSRLFLGKNKCLSVHILLAFVTPSNRLRAYPSSDHSSAFCEMVSQMLTCLSSDNTVAHTRPRSTGKVVFRTSAHRLL